MFTLEIEGTAVAVINSDEASAKDLFTCEGFKEDIRTMTSDGKPLWNGTSPLTIRAANEDEIEIFEDALAEDDGEGEFTDDKHHAGGDTAGEEVVGDVALPRGGLDDRAAVVGGEVGLGTITRSPPRELPRERPGLPPCWTSAPDPGRSVDSLTVASARRTGPRRPAARCPPSRPG